MRYINPPIIILLGSTYGGTFSSLIVGGYTLPS